METNSIRSEDLYKKPHTIQLTLLNSENGPALIKKKNVSKVLRRSTSWQSTPLAKIPQDMNYTDKNEQSNKYYPILIQSSSPALSSRRITPIRKYDGPANLKPIARKYLPDIIVKENDQQQEGLKDSSQTFRRRILAEPVQDLKSNRQLYNTKWQNNISKLQSCHQQLRIESHKNYNVAPIEINQSDNTFIKQFDRVRIQISNYKKIKNLTKINSITSQQQLITPESTNLKTEDLILEPKSIQQNFPQTIMKASKFMLDEPFNINLQGSKSSLHKKQQNIKRLTSRKQFSNQDLSYDYYVPDSDTPEMSHRTTRDYTSQTCFDDFIEVLPETVCGTTLTLFETQIQNTYSDPFTLYNN